ncbi:restriction endonuclease [Methylomonas methanica]|uniref:Restriction endonuclease n=1 Tax=Methylomonas methanica TaxID=421 RepID=A0A177MDH1_METMH|nr:restriction endonuclease [Methylomonas methanica]
MNLLQSSLIEKAGYENGFENSNSVSNSEVFLSSARHSSEITVACNGSDDQFLIKVNSGITGGLIAEISRSFSEQQVGEDTYLLPNITQLAKFLRRASTLAQALPNQAVIQFHKEIDDVMASVPGSIKNTEVERLVKQRIGQDRFRSIMLDYWGNACAVTGLSVTEVLRASHAKPWSECSTDEERLDVFNGFLLCANLDALFDRFLISFEDCGQILISPKISEDQRQNLGLDNTLSLRWITKQHNLYLNYHRSKYLEQIAT